MTPIQNLAAVLLLMALVMPLLGGIAFVTASLTLKVIARGNRRADLNRQQLDALTRSGGSR